MDHDWIACTVRVAGYATAFIAVLLACAPAHGAHPSNSTALVEREIELGDFFGGVDPDDTTFVVLEAATDEIVRYNPSRAKRRFVPASTFKIPNSLIALETGVASGPDYLIRWDSIIPNDGSFWASSWSKDHTLRSALRNSVFWYYQALARDIGADRMQRYLDQFDYGNRNMGGGLDRFSLHGDLRISPDEQVQFLERMYEGDLGLSERSTRILKQILVLESGDAYRLSGKTGTANVTATRELAWLSRLCRAGEWHVVLRPECGRRGSLGALGQSRQTPCTRPRPPRSHWRSVVSHTAHQR